MYFKVLYGAFMTFLLPLSVCSHVQHWAIRPLGRHGGGTYLANTHVLRRQSPLPPYTVEAVCPKYDGYFFLTSGNSTFQIQCDTTYRGTVLVQQDASNYTECISGCEHVNRLTAPGTCVGVTFNGTNDGTVGTCTGYSEIFQGLPAPDSSIIYDSALLVYGPDGIEYAEPDSTPVLSSTTTGVSSSSRTQSVSMTASTRQATTSKSSSSTTLTSTLSSKASVSVTTTTSSSIRISTAGPRPLDPVPTDTNSAQSTSGINSMSSSTAVSTVSDQQSAQRTFSVTVPFTVVEVHVTEICQSVPVSCSTLMNTTTVTGNRVQISCSPGLCTGFLPSVVAPVNAATCVVSP